jgi:hypothetical protein
MSVALPFADSTQRPSFPGENVHVSPAFEQVAGGSATLALSETQPANRRGAAALNMTAMGPRRERTNGRGDIAPLYIPFWRWQSGRRAVKTEMTTSTA